jgi:hypothetical protein
LISTRLALTSCSCQQAAAPVLLPLSGLTALLQQQHHAAHHHHQQQQAAARAQPYQL